VVFTGAEVQSPVAYPWSGRQASGIKAEIIMRRFPWIQRIGFNIFVACGKST